MSIEEPLGDEEIQPSFMTVDQPPTQQMVKPYMLTPTTNLAVTKGKENSYTKLGIGKYYRCGEPGHESNKCPMWRQVNMEDYEDEGEEVAIENASDSDFVEKYGDLVACVV